MDESSRVSPTRCVAPHLGTWLSADLAGGDFWGVMDEKMVKLVELLYKLYVIYIYVHIQYADIIYNQRKFR